MKRAPAHHYSALEKSYKDGPISVQDLLPYEIRMILTFAQWRKRMIHATDRSRTVPENSYHIRVTAEGSDVFFNPPDSHSLIFVSHITRNYFVASTYLPQESQSVVRLNKYYLVIHEIVR